MHINTQHHANVIYDEDGLMSIHTEFSESPVSLAGPLTPSAMSVSEPDLRSTHVAFADTTSPLKQSTADIDWTTTGRRQQRASTLSSTSSSRNMPSTQPCFLSVDNIVTSVASAIRRINPSDENENDSRETRTSLTLPVITHEPPSIPSSPIDSSNAANTSLPNPRQQPAPMSSFTSTSPALSAIPLTAMNEISVADGVLMQGPVLCAKYMKWFSHHASVTENKKFHHLRLRQTHLRWREFEAVLLADRLELYLVTDLVIKTRRLAHVIYLNKRHSRLINQVKLSLVSDVDFSWRLAFESSEGHKVQFLFLTHSLRESQKWYMALFRLATTSLVIPSLVDLYIPALNNLQICLPLSNADFKDGNNNIKISDVKRTVLNLLDWQGSKPTEWTRDNVRLCWRHWKQQAEWISDDDFLICPQLIEQTHTLELRFCPQREFPEEHTPRPVMEGDLILLTDFRGKKERMKRPVYAMLEGHLMFLLDPSDAVRLPGNENVKKPRFSFSHFSGTKTFLHVRTKRGFQSVTRFFCPNDTSFTATAPLDADKECRRRARNIENAFSVIDFTKITRVRRTPEKNVEDTIHRRSFELYLGKDVVTVWEAPTMHMMFEWIHWIHKVLQTLGRQQIRDAVPMIARARLGFRVERQWRSVLHAGSLYVRQDYETFKQRFCVLTPEKTLVLYNTCRRKRFTGEATVWTTYDHYMTVNLDPAYVYTDDAHQHEKTHNHQPPRMYADGKVISSDNSSSNAECAFVIWQTAERHILVTLRKQLAFFKIGHRLGRKGTTWVFLARSPEERAMWMWVLQQTMDQATASVSTTTTSATSPSWR